MSPSSPVDDPRPADQVVATEGVARAIQRKHVASLLYTYRCSLACKHCLFSCSPSQPDVHVSLEDGLEFLHQLRDTGRVVHIAGGEPFVYWDDLLLLCQAAQAEGMPVHFVETNASWCETDALTRDRLAALAAAGVSGMLISGDAVHQVAFPPANRFRAFEIALDVFGRENIIGREIPLDQLEELQAIARDETRLGAYVRRHPPRLVGRAGEELARFFPPRPLEELRADAMWHGSGSDDGSCGIEFDPRTMWEIHVDPYGNIQTCCGILLGTARETPLPERMAGDLRDTSEIVRLVAHRGPFGLLDLAVEKGYRPRVGYAQKCHLCWEVRKVLRPFYPEALGPAEVYEPWARR